MISVLCGHLEYYVLFCLKQFQRKSFHTRYFYHHSGQSVLFTMSVCDQLPQNDAADHLSYKMGSCQDPFSALALAHSQYSGLVLAHEVPTPYESCLRIRLLLGCHWLCPLAGNSDRCCAKMSKMDERLHLMKVDQNSQVRGMMSPLQQYTFFHHDQIYAQLHGSP